MTKQAPKIYLVEDGVDSRLDRWLKRQIPELKQGTLEKMLRMGKIRLNDKKAKAGQRLAMNDVVSVHGELPAMPTDFPSTLPPKPPLKLSKDEIAWFDSIIVWEDDDILVINKPSGLAVQGGTKTTHHVDQLLTAIGDLRGCRYRLTHRIDRDTSGILVVAKTQDMATHLTGCFKNGEVEKTYWAIIVGHATPGYGTIKASILKAGTADREKMVVDSKEGKPSVTHYRTVKRLSYENLPELSWLELTPETGRTHQIRVHCSHMGTPILGDGKYGGAMAKKSNKTLHLHARGIVIRDKDGNKLSFVAPPPEHFDETLQEYGVFWNRVG